MKAIKADRYWEYQDDLEGPWHPVTPEELLFVLLPSGDVVSYRLIVVIQEEK